ncbi:hypothetical protein C7B80_29050 [Cyanosarcina cf. burmensis CCALA 770]|nr:hypothetical protein C7B80_29050 [Cyanosarcina cf. burmensis CCALA 770]
MKSRWQPQLRIGDEMEAEQRRVTWMELFYDLVYVVAVVQLAHNLYENTIESVEKNRCELVILSSRCVRDIRKIKIPPQAA